MTDAMMEATIEDEFRAMSHDDLVERAVELVSDVSYALIDLTRTAFEGACCAIARSRRPRWGLRSTKSAGLLQVTFHLTDWDASERVFASTLAELFGPGQQAESDDDGYVWHEFAPCSSDWNLNGTLFIKYDGEPLLVMRGAPTDGDDV